MSDPYNYLYFLFHRYYDPSQMGLIPGKMITKVGYTTHLCERMCDYITYLPFLDDSQNILIVYRVLKSDDYGMVYDIEQLIHKQDPRLTKKIQYHHIQKEFYYLHEDDVSNVSFLFDACFGEKYECLTISIDDLFKDHHRISKSTSNQPNSRLLSLLDEPEHMKEYDLRKWQYEAYQNVLRFMEYDNPIKSGVIIAPTGCGKSFMMSYITIQYILTYKKDIFMITKKKEIIDQLFIDRLSQMISVEHRSKIRIFDLIRNADDYDGRIFDHSSDTYHIYIINSDKFISSSSFKEYETYTYSNVGLIIHDECHWIGGEKIYRFLSYMKNHIVDKVIGFSATPSRIQFKNKTNTFDFYGDGVDLNVIYERYYLEAMDDCDIAKIQWKFFTTQMEEVELQEVEAEAEADEESEEKKKRKYYYALNERGMENFLIYLNKEVIHFTYKKVIIWLRSQADLIRFFTYVQTNKDRYPNLINMDCFKTYSVSSGSEQLNLDRQLEKYKAKSQNAILCAVFRGTEGFDDPKTDLGIRLYVGKNVDPLLETQRMGRVMRYIKDVKTSGTYISLELFDNEDQIDHFAQRIGNWVRFIQENSRNPDSSDSSDELSTSTSTSSSVSNIIESMISFDDSMMKHIRIEDIRAKILHASYGNDLRKEYRDVKRLLRSYKITNCDEYTALAAVKMVFPIDPKNHFGDIFKGWIDYLHIDVSKYDSYLPFKKRCHMIMKRENIIYDDYSLHIDQLCKIIYQHDRTLPHYEIWYELYSLQGMNKVDDIFIEYVNDLHVDEDFMNFELV